MRKQLPETKYIVRKYLQDQEISSCYSELVWTKEWTHVFIWYILQQNKEKYEILYLKFSDNEIQDLNFLGCFFAECFFPAKVILNQHSTSKQRKDILLLK